MRRWFPRIPKERPENRAARLAAVSWFVRWFSVEFHTDRWGAALKLPLAFCFMWFDGTALGHPGKQTELWWNGHLVYSTWHGKVAWRRS